MFTKSLTIPDGSDDCTTYTAASALKVLERKLSKEQREKCMSQLKDLWEFIAKAEEVSELEDNSVGGCSCGFKAATSAELHEHMQMHTDNDCAAEAIEQGRAEEFEDEDGWMLMRSGRRVFPMRATARDIDIGDIAHGLSNLCRFGGHCRTFYSVAQHCVLVSRQVPDEHALAALLHDAAEAYLLDLPAPVKHLPALSEYRAAEDRLQHLIFDKYCCLNADLGLVQAADQLVLTTEARDLFESLPGEWRHRPENGYPVLEFTIRPLSPELARRAFLDRFEELTGFTAIEKGVDLQHDAE